VNPVKQYQLTKTLNLNPLLIQYTSSLYSW